MSAVHGRIHWNELNTTDPEGAAAFYKAVLGWDLVPVGAGDHTGWAIKKDGAVLGGAFRLGGPGLEGIPAHWFTYVSVADIDTAVADVKAAGGTLARPVYHVPTAGHIAIIQDPAGAYLGLIQPDGVADTADNKEA